MEYHAVNCTQTITASQYPHTVSLTVAEDSAICDLAACLLQ
jgi:hypothetical protein